MSTRALVGWGMGIAVALLVAVNVITPDSLIGEIAYLTVLLGAGAAAVVGALHRPRETRTAWLWVAAGICVSGLADLTYSIYVHVRGFEPNVSIADVFWLSSYVAISIGLLLLLRTGRRDDRRDIDGLIDMGVVTIVALLIVWQVAVQATLADTSVSPGVRAVWASYPILDAALLALVVRTFSRRSSGALLLGAGVSCWLFADFVYMLVPSSTTWSVWMDAGWMLGAALIAGATWSRTSRRIERPPSETVGAGRVALAIAPLLVPIVIEVVTYQRGVDPDPVPLLIASVALAALAFARSLRLVRSAASAQAELRTAEQHFLALVQRSSDAAMVFELDGRVRYVSPAARDQFGYSVDGFLGRVGRDLIHPDDLDRADAAFGAVATPGAHASQELRIIDAAGEARWVDVVLTNLVDEPAVAGLVANIRDISARKAVERDLSRMALFDDLTGLPNRRLLTQELAEQLLSRAETTALLVMDLDQFKFVNDSRGHAVGDELMRVIADRLRAALPETDTVGRSGGDEFAVICRDVTDGPAVRRRAEIVHDALGGLIDVPGSGSFLLTGSVGIAIAHPAETPERLLQQADTAMYAAKARGHAQTVVFNEQLRADAEERLTVQAELKAALRADELIVHYQPVVRLEDGTVEGVEALIRWRHPTRGLLLPGAFIPIAEQSDLIEEIGAFVLRQACVDAAWWTRAGLDLSVAVNISAAQLGNEHVATAIQTALYDSGLAPESLVVEVTETALLVGAERVLANIRAFHHLGVRVALDDFGTGYSSLSYLKQIPADIVKIDRSFITGIADNATDRGIAAAIIDLAQALGRTVVAEGVETDAQHRELRRLGCGLAQGYLWSAAVPAEALLEIARNGFPERVAASEPSRMLRIAPTP